MHRLRLARQGAAMEAGPRRAFEGRRSESLAAAGSPPAAARRVGDRTAGLLAAMRAASGTRTPGSAMSTAAVARGARAASTFGGRYFALRFRDPRIVTVSWSQRS